MSAEVLQQIESLLPVLSREEKLRLVSLLASQLSGEPTRLENRWQGTVPPDFDLDAALKEIRSEWEGEVEDITRGRPPR
jgi:hypothetical protein